jgi:hypothetical protein
VSEKRETAVTAKPRLLGTAVIVFVLAAIGSALSIVLGVHGFGRGMLIGATLMCVLLGGVLLGLALGHQRGEPERGDGWLPSRDSRA